MAKVYIAYQNFTVVESTSNEPEHLRPKNERIEKLTKKLEE